MFRGELFIHGASQHPSADPAQDHKNQHKDGKRRYAFRDGRGDQACGLGEKDDIQGIFRSRFGVHGKEIEQHHQIDRPSADAQKAGHSSEGCSDQNAGSRI